MKETKKRIRVMINQIPTWNYYIIFGLIMIIAGITLIVCYYHLFWPFPLSVGLIGAGAFAAINGFLHAGAPGWAMFCPNPRCKERDNFGYKYCACGEKFVRVYFKVKFCRQGHRIEDGRDHFKKCPKCGEPFIKEKGKSVEEIKKEYNYY